MHNLRSVGASTDGISNDDRSLSDMLAKLKGDSKLMMNILLGQFKDLRTEFTNVTAAKNEEINELRNELGDLKKTVNKLEEMIDSQDSYERRDTIILSGNDIPEVSTGEICSNIVHDIIQSKLRIQLAPNEINTAHRLGPKKQSQGPDKRPIIVKLCRRDTKRQLTAAARSQNSTSPLYVNESLTPKRRTILYALRQMKKAQPSMVVGCSSVDGQVYAFTKSTREGARNVRHSINSHVALVEFCREHVKKPLDTFLSEWVH